MNKIMFYEDIIIDSMLFLLSILITIHFTLKDTYRNVFYIRERERGQWAVYYTSLQVL